MIKLAKKNISKWHPKRKATVLAKSCFRQGSKTANIPNAGTTSTTTTEVNPSTRETTNKKNPYSQLATDDDEDGNYEPSDSDVSYDDISVDYSNDEENQEEEEGKEDDNSPSTPTTKQG